MTPTDLQKPEREFIDIGAGYEVATVGQGSTFRIHGPNDEMVIVSPTFYHPFYTTMARAIKAEREANAARVIELEAENKRLRASLGRMLLEFDFLIEANLIRDDRNDVIFVEARTALKGGEI